MCKDKGKYARSMPRHSNYARAFNLNAQALEWIREEDAMVLKNGCCSIWMKEESGTKIRKLDAQASEMNAATSKICKIDAQASKTNVAACEAKQGSRGFNAQASKSECLAIGSTSKKKISPILIKLLSLISLPNQV